MFSSTLALFPGPNLFSHEGPENEAYEADD